MSDEKPSIPGIGVLMTIWDEETAYGDFYFVGMCKPGQEVALVTQFIDHLAIFRPDIYRKIRFDTPQAGGTRMMLNVNWTTKKPALQQLYDGDLEPLYRTVNPALLKK